jgi:hypothetical protein
MIRIVFLTFGFLFIFQFSHAQYLQVNNVTSYTVPGGQYSSPTQGVVLIALSGSSGNNYVDTPITFNVDGNQWTAVVSGSSGRISWSGSRYAYSSNGAHQVSVTVNYGQTYNLNVKSYVGYTTVVELAY